MQSEILYVLQLEGSQYITNLVNEIEIHNLFRIEFPFWNERFVVEFVKIDVSKDFHEFNNN